MNKIASINTKDNKLMLQFNSLFNNFIHYTMQLTDIVNLMIYV
jgi:hypothetical protein